MNRHKVNLKIYWTDYIISSVLFLISFYFVYTASSVIAFLIACTFLYRIGAFTHELAHQNNNPKMKLFKRVWNATTGFLILQPSQRFIKPHLKHHTTGIFATKEDPQYPLIFKDTKLAIIIFVILPWFLPIYNLITCTINALEFESNKWHSILYPDITYTLEEEATITLYEKLYCLLLILISIINIKLIGVFYLVSVGAWYLSVLRIPLEHPLSEYKKTSTVRDQEALSYTRTNPVYIIVQPLSLRFHKEHHMFPKIPYHNLRDGISID